MMGPVTSRRHVLGGGLATLALAAFGRPARAAAQLTTSGTFLGQFRMDASSVTLDWRVSLAGDVPEQTHVSAHTQIGKRYQRTNEGFWIPWDGKLFTLVDNNRPVESDTVEFKIFADEDLSDEVFPIRIVIGYDIGGDFKFGTIELFDSTGT